MMAGDKRRRYLMSIRGSAKLDWEKLPLKLIRGSVPDRSPGHAFIVMTRPRRGNDELRGRSSVA